MYTLLEDNDFFPAVPDGKVDHLPVQPQQPNGHPATTKAQLKTFDHYAASTAVILYDSAYTAFITDPGLPRSIYEVEGQNCRGNQQLLQDRRPRGAPPGLSCPGLRLRRCRFR